jgi:hypothetical protein
VVNGARDLLAAAGDLAFQRGDPNLQFGDGQGIQILPHELRQKITGPGKGVFGFHLAGQR